MSKMDIKFNGGQVAVGNIVQGDHNVVHSNVSIGVDDLFRDFQANLPALARPFERPQPEIARLAKEIEALKVAAIAPQPDLPAGQGILKTIRDNFSWAYPAVKDLLAAAWPAVLGAIGG